MIGRCAHGSALFCVLPARGTARRTKDMERVTAAGLRGAARAVCGLPWRQPFRCAAMGAAKCSVRRAAEVWFAPDGRLRRGAACPGCAGKTVTPVRSKGAGNEKRHFFS